MGLGTFASNSTLAATIFESGTLGPTGITFAELISQNIPGVNVNQSTFAGVRFSLDHPASINQIGGHFAAGASGTLFGAVVALDDESDFPNSTDFSTPDFLGSTLLTLPLTSDEVFADLSLSLDSGWYALIFGSGLLEASGAGAAVGNNRDLGSPVYIGHDLNIGWFELAGLSPIFANYRFVVNGVIVPEPSAIALAALAWNLSLTSRRRAKILSTDVT